MAPSVFLWVITSELHTIPILILPRVCSCFTIHASRLFIFFTPAWHPESATVVYRDNCVKARQGKMKDFWLLNLHTLFTFSHSNVFTSNVTREKTFRMNWCVLANVTISGNIGCRSINPMKSQAQLLMLMLAWTLIASRTSLYTVGSTTLVQKQGFYWNSITGWLIMFSVDGTVVTDVDGMPVRQTC